MIRELLAEQELRDSAAVIRAAFRTVADDFGLTTENCPSHTAFTTDEQHLARVADGVRVFAIYRDDRQVAVAGLLSMDGQKFELKNLAVLPEYRHLGYGRQLVNHLCRCAKAAGGSVAHIGIINENVVLKHWYLMQGFVELGSKRFPHLPFTVCWMEKPLEEIEDEMHSAPAAFRIGPPREPDWPWMLQAHAHTAWEFLPPDRRQGVTVELLQERLGGQLARMHALDDPTCTVFVARDAEGNAAGFLWIEEAHSGFTGETDAYITEVYVSPAYRRQGAGRLLLARAEAWAHARGLQRISLNVAAHNTGAKQLYDAMAFQTESVRMGKIITTKD